jgi:hypothetical protein
MIIISYKSIILKIANSVRGKMVSRYGDSVLSEKCLQVSKVLKKELEDNGFSCNVVQGVFKIDNPDSSLEGEMDKDLFESEEEFREAMFYPLHYWVEVNGKILDISGSQFNSELNEKWPDVFLGNSDRYKKIESNWI